MQEADDLRARLAEAEQALADLDRGRPLLVLDAGFRAGFGFGILRRNRRRGP